MFWLTTIFKNKCKATLFLMPKIFPQDIRIERLDKNHSITNFQSYEPELVKFLQEDALDNQSKKISVTYLWFLKETNELIGYFTLLNDKINLEGDLKEYFNDKGIFYHSLPAMKIGRLAVDDRFLRRGIGTLMIAYITSRAKQIADRIAGCRFITVDAKRNNSKTNDTLYFYKKVNFEILRNRENITFMYLDLNR